MSQQTDLRVCQPTSACQPHPQDLPTLTLPDVVVMKLISARPQDSADISRMLGSASEQALQAVRAIVKKGRPDDAEDLEQMIAAGQLEFGPPRGK
jgi:hypothetical protein